MRKWETGHPPRAAPTLKHLSNQIPLDQARLRPHLRNVTPYRLTPVDAGITEPTSTLKLHGWEQPEPQDLRGIPVIGPGVGGVSPHTQPERETIRRLTSKERAA